MKFVRNTLISSLSIIATAYLIPGFVIQNFSTALLAALVLGLVNTIIKPIMLFLTFPINIITLGLFTFVINASMLALAAYIVPGFNILGFVPALLGSLTISIISYALNTIFKN